MNVDAVVFAGPSLSGSLSMPSGVALHGPAMAGDLYRAARGGARVIGLVDGVFEDRPTVWHKEILWALDRGVRVLGAASLGALRAAECAAFGMEGIGSIFERCRDGTLEDDAELAVAHAPAELGWRPLTEALVNVRATVEAATAGGVLTRRHAREVIARAEALPFRERTWPALLLTVPDPHACRLADWLSAGRVDLKRADALLLVDAVAMALAGAEGPAPTSFRFAETRYWQAAVAWFERDETGLGAEDAAVLDELRLDPARFERAMLRAFALRAVAEEPDESAPDGDDLLDEMRLSNGLATAADFRAWLDRSRAQPDRLALALEAEDRLAAAVERAIPALAPAVLDALRLDGRFEALAQRAEDKRARLATRPAHRYREPDLLRMLDDLCARRRVSIDCGDLDLVARSLGLPDRVDLHRLLAAEQDYARAIADEGG